MIVFVSFGDKTKKGEEMNGSILREIKYCYQISGSIVDASLNTGM